jgi:hypothetical protein
MKRSKKQTKRQKKAETQKKTTATETKKEVTGTAKRPLTIADLGSAQELEALHDSFHAQGVIHFIERQPEGYYMYWPHDDEPLPLKPGTYQFQRMLLPEWFDVPELAIGERVQG